MHDLTTQYMPYIENTAKRFAKKYYLSQKDTVQEAVLISLELEYLYMPEKGAKYSTFLRERLWHGLVRKLLPKKSQRAYHVFLVDDISKILSDDEYHDLHDTLDSLNDDDFELINRRFFEQEKVDSYELQKALHNFETIYKGDR